MLKPTERMHTRSKMVQIGASCMGQQLVACYRAMKDDETGLSFCMMMGWAEHDEISFFVQETDELMHLWFEDNGCDWPRERELTENGDLDLDESVTDSAAYKKVYNQLLNWITKQMNARGYTVNGDLSLTRG